MSRLWNNVRRHVMNLKHVQYVLTILREGSITAASKKLYVS